MQGHMVCMSAALSAEACSLPCKLIGKRTQRGARFLCAPMVSTPGLRSAASGASDRLRSTTVTGPGSSARSSLHPREAHRLQNTDSASSAARMICTYCSAASCCTISGRSGRRLWLQLAAQVHAAAKSNAQAVQGRNRRCTRAAGALSLRSAGCRRRPRRRWPAGSAAGAAWRRRWRRCPLSCWPALRGLGTRKHHRIGDTEHSGRTPAYMTTAGDVGDIVYDTAHQSFIALKQAAGSRLQTLWSSHCKVLPLRLPMAARHRGAHHTGCL